jgi:DNA polymerase-3 subunit delta'
LAAEAEATGRRPVQRRLPWQDQAWSRLQQVLAAGRLPHGLLLTGMAGVGKAEFAAHLAHALVCSAPTADGDPCGQCRNCQLAMAGNHPDIHWYQPEEPGKAIKVDAIRELAQSSVLTAGGSGRSVYIVEPADAMNAAAANALLKTLEEPAGGAVLILASASPDRLPATIRSRCQQLALTPPAADVAAAWLSERGVAPARARRLLDLFGGAPLRALAADGQDLLEVLDGMWAAFERLAQGRGDPVAVAEEWKAHDLAMVLDWLILWSLDLLQVQADPSRRPRFDAAAAERFQTLAERLDCKDLHGFVDTLYDLRRRLTSNLNGQLVLERLLLDWNRLTARARN